MFACSVEIERLALDCRGKLRRPTAILDANLERNSFPDSTVSPLTSNEFTARLHSIALDFV